MTKLISLSTLFIAILFVFSCGKDDDADTVDYDYHAHVHSPNTDAKHVGDTIQLDISFESHTGEPVHHINVRIYNKADNTEVYNKPSVKHVHATSGTYEYTDEFILSANNGIAAHTDWVLEAKVWGEEDGEGEVVETLEFHVHPE